MKPKACPMCGTVDLHSGYYGGRSRWICASCGLPVALRRQIEEAQKAADVLRREVGKGGQECPACVKALDKLDRALGRKP